jgi:putative acetyltransferase
MKAEEINVREELAADIEAIRAVNFAAFSRPDEGAIVDALRVNGAVWLSLVATLSGRVVGHALYSPVCIDGEEGEIIGAGLGPMAVLPEHQRNGIGSKLIHTGSEKLKQSGCPFIVVLGYPEYYPRFGFQPAGIHQIRCQWDVPDNVFMILFLDERKMRGITGLAKYRDEFAPVV